MKKSYIQLITVELILLLFLFLNSYITSILSRYNLIICLVLMIVLFKYVLGVEKDNHSFIKDIVLELMIFLLVYFLTYYGLGMITGFYRAGSYLTLNGLRKYILPISLIVILKEILRYMLVLKAKDNKVLNILTVLVFVGIDVSNYLFYNSYGTIYEIGTILTLCVIPSLCMNITCSYIAFKGNAVPNIIYQLIMNLYIYLLPIFTDMNDIFKGVFVGLFSLLLLFKMYILFAKYGNEMASNEINIKKGIYVVITLIFIGASVILAFMGFV